MKKYLLLALIATPAFAEDAPVAKPWPMPPAIQVGPQGPQGPAGPAAPIDKIASYISTATALGALQTRTPSKGQLTGAFGISGTDYGSDGAAAAIRYGISDRADIYGVVGHSRRGGTAWGLGLTFTLN